MRILFKDIESKALNVIEVNYADYRECDGFGFIYMTNSDGDDIVIKNISMTQSDVLMKILYDSGKLDLSDCLVLMNEQVDIDID